MLRLAIACVAVTSALARADGVYVDEAYGVAIGRGQLAPIVGTSVHLHIGAGVRYGFLAVEAWTLSDMQTDRDGAWHGLVGGEPAMGKADLDAWGADVKMILPVEHALSAYVRFGPSVASGNGALAGYEGRGIGFGYGLQLTGRVRALGFVWAPLFLVKRGPLITGALYIDEGYDFYALSNRMSDRINAHVGHISAGFGVGSSF